MPQHLGDAAERRECSSGSTEIWLMRKSHPQYLRPTVAQVICQIRFTASEKWQANRPQELLSRLAGDYPIVEPVAPVFAIQIGPTAAPSMRSVSGVTTSVIKVSSPDQAVSI